MIVADSTFSCFPFPLHSDHLVIIFPLRGRAHASYYSIFLDKLAQQIERGRGKESKVFIWLTVELFDFFHVIWCVCLWGSAYVLSRIESIIKYALPNQGNQDKIEWKVNCELLLNFAILFVPLPILNARRLPPNEIHLFLSRVNIFRLFDIKCSSANFIYCYKTISHALVIQTCNILLKSAFNFAVAWKHFTFAIAANE